MKRKLLVLALGLSTLGGLSSCEELEAYAPAEKRKTGCVCNDGTTIKWDENLLIHTNNLTGNPCWDKGGIREYLYN